MTFRQLSQGDRSLLSLMQSVYYGRLENLAIRNGHAVVTKESRKIRSHKIGAAKHSHDAGQTGADFLLNEKQQEFLTAVSGIADGIINEIQIQAGLPVSLETEEVIASI